MESAVFMSDISELQRVRQRILARYHSDPHVCVSLPRSKPELKAARAEITGVYAHIFQIETDVDGQTQQHSLQYADILLGSAQIAGL